VAWYKAEGNANDAIGHNTGAVVGTGVTYGPGEVGQAFRFSGPGYVDVPDAPDLEPKAVTVEAWVKSGDGETTEPPYWNLVAKGQTSSRYASYALYVGPDGGIGFYVWNGLASTPQVAIYGDPGIWNGQWHHVAGTYDGQTVRLYIDGQQLGNGTTGAGALGYGLPAGNDLTIGNVPVPHGASYFDGSIDELSIYNRALTAAEIQAIYHAGSAGKSNNPPPPPPPSTATGVEVDLPLGTATALSGGVTHIQNLIGSPGNDILVGNGGNMIDGGGGQDLLIAGPTASTVQGAGADILVGGQTADDLNMAALEQVLMAWTDPTADFPTRVSRITQGLFATGTVTPNHQHNVLAAGAGPNLFFSSASDTTNKSNADVSIEL
jgi:hypothetical protein